MITFSPTIPIPNINRAKCISVFVNDEISEATLQLQILLVGGRIYPDAETLFLLRIRNNEAQGLRANAGALGTIDTLQRFTGFAADPQGITGIATIYTDIAAAYLNTAGGSGARKLAVETLLPARGIVMAGTAS